MNQVELNEFRVARFQAAIERISAGNKTVFGRKLGYKDGAYVRQMLGGIRPITEKTIYKIESMRGMRGWFNAPESLIADAHQRETSNWPFAEWVSLDRIQSLSREDLAFLAGKLDAALDEIEKKD